MIGGRKVLIVGGGIAGLTLATGLQRKGCHAEIVEIQPQWNISGVGISLTGPTLRALRTIDLLDGCIEVSFGFSQILMFDAQGNPIGALDVPPLNGPDYPGMVAISRPALHDFLLQAAEKSGARIWMGLTVSSLNSSSSGVDVAFADGRTETYDLVVGADGFRSDVRRIVFDDAPKAQFTGLAVWRAGLERSPEIECMRMFYGPRNKAGLNPISRDKMFMFLVQPIADARWPPPEHLHELLRDELSDYGGIMATVRESITDRNKVDYRPMDAFLLPPPWFRGRVLLTGDAVHTTTPHLATGAGIAIEDAVVLAELHDSKLTIPECLDQFMARRFERARLAVENSVTLGEWEKNPGIPVSDHMALMKETFASLAQPL